MMQFLLSNFDGCFLLGKYCFVLMKLRLKVSHKFGYGLMDAGAMVSLAEQWTNVPPQHICKSQEINEERPIDPTYGYTLSAYMDVSGCAGTLNEVRFLEHVQCKVSHISSLFH